MKERLAWVAVGAGLLTGCSTEISGEAKPTAIKSDLEIAVSVSAFDHPGLGGSKRTKLEVGTRVLGICLSYPSSEASTLATGFMKVAYMNEEMYIPTLSLQNNGKPRDVFTISEKELEKRYIRCEDERRR